MYLCITPQSASSRPPSVIYGMTYGLLWKYHEQNTHQDEYIEMVVLIFWQLRASGCDEGLPKGILNEASAKLVTPHPLETSSEESNSFYPR